MKPEPKYELYDIYKFYKKDYWSTENLLYSQPYFRLEKVAKIVNALSREKECDLLDIGCGPATLAKLLQKNINYYGVDIAIQEAKPNLIEMDFLENEIRFKDKTFDIIVASGVFEYMGLHQKEKLSEIQKILNKNGKFIVTFSNLTHIEKPFYPSWNNLQSIKDMKSDLSLFFRVEKHFPAYHSTQYAEVNNKFLKGKILRKFQMTININIPFISPLLGVNYIFICSLKPEFD